MSQTEKLRQIDDWIRRNPYRIVNVSNIHQPCGRFPSLAAALDAADAYESGPLEINGFDILVRECPKLAVA